MQPTPIKPSQNPNRPNHHRQPPFATVLVWGREDQTFSQRERLEKKY